MLPGSFVCLFVKIFGFEIACVFVYVRVSAGFCRTAGTGDPEPHTRTQNCKGVPSLSVLKAESKKQTTQKRSQSTDWEERDQEA